MSGMIPAILKWAPYTELGCFFLPNWEIL